MRVWPAGGASASAGSAAAGWPGISMGEVVTTASGGGAMGASTTGGGSGIDLVFVSTGAHNPPGAPHGVLQPTSEPATTPHASVAARLARFFFSIDAPT